MHSLLRRQSKENADHVCLRHNAILTKFAQAVLY